MAEATAKVEGKVCQVCHRAYRSEEDFLNGTSRWRLCTQGNLWFNCNCGSTLMLVKGKFAWWSPEKALTEEARSVFNRLGNLKDLPHIPSRVMEIQQLLQTPDVEARDVARAVRRDPVIATQVLRAAETVRCARAPATAKITSVEHAVVYIGLKTLVDLVQTSALRTMPLPASDFDDAAFWEEGYLTGVFAEVLARRFAPTLSPDEAFLAGSLCNLGKLVLAFCFPPLVNKVVRDVGGLGGGPLVTWRQAEQAYAFPDHCVLGEIAAMLWGFPSLLQEAVRRHHEISIPRAAQGGTPRLELSDLAAAANQLTHWVLLRPHRMEESLLQAFARRVKLSEKGLEELARELTLLKGMLVTTSTKSA